MSKLILNERGKRLLAIAVQDFRFLRTANKALTKLKDTISSDDRVILSINFNYKKIDKDLMVGPREDTIIIDLQDCIEETDMINSINFDLEEFYDYKNINLESLQELCEDSNLVLVVKDSEGKISKTEYKQIYEDFYELFIVDEQGNSEKIDFDAYNNYKFALVIDKNLDNFIKNS